MANLGLPVPPGFTITTEVCTAFYQSGRRYPEGLEGEVKKALAFVEDEVGAKFGDPARPLLVSVRSGARASMPGMMDTVLNLGLNDRTVEGLAARAGDARFAYDSYRRFIQMYSGVVLGVAHHNFEDILEEYKDSKGLGLDTELLADDWKVVLGRYARCVEEATGKPFPQDVDEQLWGAIGAVFGSWQSPRAITYRRLHGIPEDWGTAVNVQAMVFGNMGETSATGVAFTRNPSTGEKEIYGEFLANAQGEDVVAGIRTPQSLTEKARLRAGSEAPSLERLMPETFRDLSAIFDRLEKHYRDMQDLEFTVERGTLFLLQTRTGKRTGSAAVRIAVEMVEEGVISKEEALQRVAPDAVEQLMHPMVDPKASCTVLATGLPASPGAACGQVVFDAAEAKAWAGEGKAVILVRPETSPEDIQGMHAAKGILTSRGGMTSHAAVVARGMGKCCVVGATAVLVDVEKAEMHVDGRVLPRGTWVTLDGTTGRVIEGQVRLVPPSMTGHFETFMSWADEFRRLGVRANADTPGDAARARGFGAQGIGLCRTEHMFFEADRIEWMRKMILARDAKGRREALAHLLPMQRSDFEGILEAMDGLPVTIRLLDPPLHEFLPHEAEQVESLAADMGVSPRRLADIVETLKEQNPMLGHRGCRLGITYPEITEMQARAIFEAAVALAAKGKQPIPEVMVPLVADVSELRHQVDLVRRTATAVFAKAKREVPYLVGTMIELPRAALTADEIAEVAEFFSYGTNDLTQTTYGLSRDDAGKFLPQYLQAKIWPHDPFQVLDQRGVGKLVRLGIELGRGRRSDLKVGICGEHGGEPSSVAFCHTVGMNYVSCSPFRVPIARLAAAQAALRESGVEDRTAATV
jgi:pyruvate,orthophosphate dikinase